MPDRSDLGDLIVERGPFAVGDVMQSPNGHPFITAAEINQLRDELIRLRRVEAAVQGHLARWLGETGEVYDIRRFTDDLRATVRGDA